MASAHRSSLRPHKALVLRAASKAGRLEADRFNVAFVQTLKYLYILRNPMCAMR
ncbi:hypothetical protein GGE56_004382 [Rhizobium leguminosarum]|nr:hypothetical protein [Rhizobium leguminosarum]MBB6296071.1 hypothetical protein [Rhizobium leguminosarum]